MKKAYRIHYGNVYLRPVEMDDADFIVKIRNSPSAIGNIHETDTDLQKQISWIKNYIERENDYYFIVCFNDRPCGTVGLYDIVEKSGEWGRWIIQENSIAALASAIMICEFGFNILNLQKIYGNVVEHNKKVLSFHRKYGMREIGIVPNATKINKKYVNYIRYELTCREWESVKEANCRILRSIIGDSNIICF